jgi:hypothetical protein
MSLEEKLTSITLALEMLRFYEKEYEKDKEHIHNLIHARLNLETKIREMYELYEKEHVPVIRKVPGADYGLRQKD